MIESVIKFLPILLIGLLFVCLVIEEKLSMDTKKHIEKMNVDFENYDKIMAKIEKDINAMGKTIDDFQEKNNTIKKIIADIQEKNNTNSYGEFEGTFYSVFVTSDGVFVGYESCNGNTRVLNEQETEKLIQTFKKIKEGNM